MEGDLVISIHKEKITPVAQICILDEALESSIDGMGNHYHTGQFCCIFRCCKRDGIIDQYII